MLQAENFKFTLYEAILGDETGALKKDVSYINIFITLSSNERIDWV